MPLDRHLTPDFQQNTQVPRTVNTHTELTGGPAYPDCKPPPGRSVTKAAHEQGHINEHEHKVQGVGAPDGIGATKG